MEKVRGCQGQKAHNVDGTTLHGGSVDFGDAFWTTPNASEHEWTIFSGATGVSGLSNLAFNDNGQTAPGVFSFDTVGNDVVLRYSYTVAVPEPTTLMLFGLAVCVGFGRRRRQDT